MTAGLMMPAAGDLGQPSALPPAAPPDLGQPLAQMLPPPPPPPKRMSPIAIENKLPGDSGWQRTASSAGLYGFADRQSYLPGDVVTVQAAAEVATTATWELWRLGYYGGSGGRRISSGGPVAIPQAAPAVMDPSTGMVRAPWAPSFTFTLPASLVTGVYLVKLTSATAQSYVILVVREAARAAPIVWPLAFNTYQAYNAWGGTSLYDNNRSDWGQWHAYAVSFDRPFAQGDGAGQLFYADRDFLTFVEGEGYDIDYVVDSDVDADPSELAGRHLIVLQGHNEYISATERGAISDGVGSGTSLAVFGANDLYWQVRYAASASGAARRVMIGYKEFAARDPMSGANPELVTRRWRDLGKPENAILGVMYGEWILSAAPLQVSDSTSWLWSGAQLQSSALIPGLYGFEVDRRYDNNAEPDGVTEIGRGLTDNHQGASGYGQATLYTAPSGAMVFASGTVAWSQALAAPGQWDARVQQATHNLVAQMSGCGKVGAPPRQLVLGAAPTPPRRVSGVQVSTVTAALAAPSAVAVAPNGDALVVDGDRVVRVTPGGSVIPVAGSASGDADGTPGAFAAPRGIAVGSDGTIYVADSGNHKLKQIATSGAVRTLAGSAQGFADGMPGQLDTPVAIAVTPSGAVVVADLWNQRVRAWTAAGLTTWAGDGKQASIDGPGTRASLYFPFAVAALPDGSVALAESEDGLVRRISGDATHTVSTLAGEIGRVGWQDGPVSTASVSELAGLAARPGGDLVLLDSATYRVRLLAGGGVTTLAGGETAALTDGDGAVAGFGYPRAAAFGDGDTLYVVDVGNHALRRLALP